MDDISSPYSEILKSLRRAFPQPISDREHDAYFAFSFLRVLDEIDSMKSEVPMLGEPASLDFESARQCTIAAGPQTVEAVSSDLVRYFSGMYIWGHPRSQINVVSPASIPSIIGDLLPAIYKPNLCDESTSRGIALAEVEATSITADLVGYDAQVAGGFFTFGGTGTLLYGIRAGLEKACPGTAQDGVRQPARIVASDRAHYACLTAASWLGLGRRHVVSVPTHPDSSLRLPELEAALRELLDEQIPIAAIVATMGTTDAFGIDDLAAMVRMRDRLVEEYELPYVPHLHADAVIGWAWCAFNDYAWDDNPLGFPPRTVRALAAAADRMQHLGLADSLGVDFHKTGYTPYVSSLFLARDAHDLHVVERSASETPYLFHAGEYHPGKLTLETSRGGAGPLAALANYRLFGRSGLQSLVGHAVSMADSLRQSLTAHTWSTVFNEDNVGPVTLFRVYPDDVNTFSVPERELTDRSYLDQVRRHNEYNRRVYRHLYEASIRGEGIVISLTDGFRKTGCGEPIVTLKSYILSPFVESDHADVVFRCVADARAAVNQDWA